MPEEDSANELERLRQSEARLRLVGHVARIGSFDYDTETGVSACSPEYLELYGLPQDGPSPTYPVWLALVHPDDRAWVERETQGAVADPARSRLEYEFRIVRADTGAVRWLTARTELQRDADGRFVRSIGAQWDVTERREAQSALRQSEKRFRLIVENARDYAIFTLDPEGRVADWLPGAENVFGWRADEARGEHVAITFTDEDRAAGTPEGELDTARREGAAPNVRWHVRKDGSRTFIDGITTAIRDVDGALTGFLKIGQDVTERRRAETALLDSEERLRQFAEATSDVLWIADAQSRQLEYLSPAYEKVWGEPRDAVMADLAHWSERLHPEDAAHASQGFGRLLRGERYQAEYRIVRPDGDARYILDTAFPILKDGHVVRVAGVAQDLTDRRRVEQALAENEGRLSGLIDALPQLVWRGAREAQWTWASPQWTTYTGQTDAESRGEGWLDALHPDDREGARRAWAGAATFGGFRVDYRIRDRNGVYRWFNTQARPIRDEGGRIIEWVGTSTDVDELYRLQRHQRLLLAELQHRVRNTLGVVRSIVRRTAGTSRTVEDMEGHLQGRLAAFSRVQAALTRAAEAGVDLEGLVEDELLAHAARESPDVRVKGPEVVLTPRIAETLSLAVHELTSNAVKHGALSTEGARLDVGWTVEPRDRANWLEFDWRETGVRLPANAPAREGFGLELLERQLPYELDARTRAEFAPTGFHFTLSMPLPEPGDGGYAPAMAAE